MRVVLIESTSEDYRNNPLSQMARVLEPLAIEYIGAYLKTIGHDVHLLHQLDEDHESVLQRMRLLNPDVVGFSCMSYAYPETISLAQAVKRLLPGVATVLGGYHVIGMATCPSCFDYVVQGEGELAMAAILARISGDGEPETIPGLRFAGGVWQGHAHARVDVGSMPMPERLPRDNYFSISMGENMPDTRLACVILGRGCPFSCDFCCTPQLFPGKRLLRDVEQAVNEIILLRDTLGVNTINLRDETFAPRGKVVEFCDELIRRNANVSWRAFANIGVLDESTIALMADAGCHMIFYGIEASDSATLKMRRKSSRIDQIARDIRAAQSHGIFVRGGFIVGHETDTEESFAYHEEFLRGLCPDELYVSFLTPFPGTPLHKKMEQEGRLLTTDLRKYDCEHPIIDIGLPQERLIELRMQLYRNFYTSREWRGHLSKRIDKNPAEEATIKRYTRFVAESFSIPDPMSSGFTMGVRQYGN